VTRREPAVIVVCAALVAAMFVAACGSPSSPPGADAASDLLDTPANTWPWVEIPGTTCGNGTPAGFGINRSTVGPDLFIYFQGGGACWDATTCFVAKAAVHIEDTYTAATFASEIGAPIVNHDDPSNPLAAATFVNIPYCTGDLHAGARTATYDLLGTPRTVAHVGGTNTQRFIDALRVAFPDVRTLWLAGSSAGGFGATLNHHRFVTAWPTAAVHTLQDSSPFLTPTDGRYAAWQAAWSLQFPPSCGADCTTSLSAVLDAVTAANPTSRFGLMHYDDDATIKLFFGFPATAGSMVAASNALLDDHYALPTTQAFMLAGTTHTMLGQLATLTSPGGVRLVDWVVDWATGAPAWATVRP
jgi:hypothetical protein